MRLFFRLCLNQLVEDNAVQYVRELVFVRKNAFNAECCVPRLIYRLYRMTVQHFSLNLFRGDSNLFRHRFPSFGSSRAGYSRVRITSHGKGGSITARLSLRFDLL